MHSKWCQPVEVPTAVSAALSAEDEVVESPCDCAILTFSVHRPNDIISTPPQCTYGWAVSIITNKTHCYILHPLNDVSNNTKSSAIAEGPRDAPVNWNPIHFCTAVEKLHVECLATGKLNRRPLKVFENESCTVSETLPLNLTCAPNLT